jgi:16S rRNA (adenine1518-N6/adenine1519-N6)-dimethyltransferase
MEPRQLLKKWLGQHLLKEKNLLHKMVRLAQISGDDVVVEIGPGQGDLTGCIAAKAGFVWAVEVDRQFRDALETLERRLPNVRVVFSDILRIKLAAFRQGAAITVMGNIPYSLTGEILFKLLFEKAVVRAAYLTVQREVAERLVSPSHSRSYGALSVIFQLHATVKVLFLVKPALFIPPPKVESAFISLVFRDGLEADQGLIAFIKRCFRYKRKYLRHCLQGGFPPGEIDSLYGSMGFSPSVRAEEIEPEGFVAMYRFLEGRGGA